MARIPDLPGSIVPRRSEQEQWLKHTVASLLNLEHDRFPGSQPVSFGTTSLRNLELQDYWVCEKSDGVRVLLFIHTDRSSNDQSVYIIDRRNEYRELTGLYFPHHEIPALPLQSTLIDAELVYDVDPQTKRETMCLYAFDALLADGQNVMPKPFDKRYGRLKQWFHEPHKRMLKDHPRMADSQPFEIKLKIQKFSYAAEQIFNEDIPTLRHGNDGLIYTCLSTPYVPGTDVNILKWKPPSENSIDFKLVLRFPPRVNNPQEPDFHAKPVFALHVWCGDERGVPKYEQYDEMYVSDDDWESMKQSGEQFDDRIVEVHWDPSISGWRMMRFRNDKLNGNHKSVVENIVQSIADGVEKSTLLAATAAIRVAYKARQMSSSQANSNQRPQPSRPPPPQVKARYGPFAPPTMSKVSGPTVVLGMKR